MSARIRLYSSPVSRLIFDGAFAPSEIARLSPNLYPSIMLRPGKPRRILGTEGVLSSAHMLVFKSHSVRPSNQRVPGLRSNLPPSPPTHLPASGTRRRGLRIGSNSTTPSSAIHSRRSRQQKHCVHNLWTELENRMLSSCAWPPSRLTRRTTPKILRTV